MKRIVQNRTSCNEVTPNNMVFEIKLTRQGRRLVYYKWTIMFYLWNIVVRQNLDFSIYAEIIPDPSNSKLQNMHVILLIIKHEDEDKYAIRLMAAANIISLPLTQQFNHNWTCGAM